MRAFAVAVMIVGACVASAGCGETTAPVETDAATAPTDSAIEPTKTGPQAPPETLPKIDALISDLDADSPALRIAAARALPALYPDAARASFDLVDLVDDAQQPPAVRAASRHALAELAAHGVADLVHEVRSSDRWVVGYKVVGRLGPAVAPPDVMGIERDRRVGGTAGAVIAATLQTAELGSWPAIFLEQRIDSSADGRLAAAGLSLLSHAAVRERAADGQVSPPLSESALVDLRAVLATRSGRTAPALGLLALYRDSGGPLDDLLMECVAADSPSIRAGACAALGGAALRIGDRLAVVEGVARDDDNWRVRGRAIELLGRADALVALRALSECDEVGVEADVPGRAIAQLLRAGAFDRRDLAADLLQAGDHSILEAAIRYPEHATALVYPLARLLHDDGVNPRRRLLCFRALNAIGVARRAEIAAADQAVFRLYKKERERQGDRDAADVRYEVAREAAFRLFRKYEWLPPIVLAASKNRLLLLESLARDLADDPGCREAGILTLRHMLKRTNATPDPVYGREPPEPDALWDAVMPFMGHRDAAAIALGKKGTESPSAEFDLETVANDPATRPSLARRARRALRRFSR